MSMLSVILFAVVEICVSRALVILSPQRADVLEGGSVLFTCLGERNGHSHWIWSSSNQHSIYIHYDFDECDDFSTFKNNSLYSVYCNVSSTSILIRNITKSRHGERWECDFESVRSNSAILYVIVPVTSVQIDSAGSIVSPKENSYLHISCLTSFARPAPNITWYLTEKLSGIEGQKPFLHGNIVKITNNTDELFSTKSELLVRVNRSFDGSTLYCSANNYQGITVFSANILLDIQYIVSFFVKGFEGDDMITVRENDTIQFTCLIGTVASNAKLTYQAKTVLVEDFDTINLTYTVQRVSSRDAGVYTCVERNALNNSKLSIGHLTLLVKFPPHVHPNTPNQEYVQAKPGDIVTFSVDIIAYPEPRLSDFVWKKLTNSNWTTVNNSLHTEISIRRLQTNLTIKSVTEEDYGKYLLTVTNELGSYPQNFHLQNAGTEELANNNVIAIAIGSVVGIAVLIGIIGVAIFLTRSANQKREFPCISMITKWKGKKTSTIWKTSSSAAAESNVNPGHAKPQNIYEKLRRSGEEKKEYQEIQFGEDDKCVYKNMQLCPPPASS